MCFFSIGPSYTMSCSSFVKSLNGTSVLTPIARHTSVIKDHIKLFQGATAPSSIVKSLLGINESIFTVSIVPIPPHLGQAPEELKAYSSALNP